MQHQACPVILGRVAKFLLITASSAWWTCLWLFIGCVYPEGRLQLNAEDFEVVSGQLSIVSCSLSWSPAMLVLFVISTF